MRFIFGTLKDWTKIISRVLPKYKGMEYLSIFFESFLHNNAAAIELNRMCKVYVFDKKEGGLGCCECRILDKSWFSKVIEHVSFDIDPWHKTNRYKQPLLKIVDVTSTKLSFSAAFAYLEHEQQDNFIWAFQNVR